MIAVDFDPTFMWVISIHEHAKGRKLPYAFQPSFRAYMPSEIYDEALMLYKKAKHFYGVNIGHFLLIYSIAGFAELEFVNHDKPEPCSPEKIIKLILRGIKVGGGWYPYPPYEFFDTAEIIEGSKALIHEKRCSKLQKAAGKLKKEIATLRLTELSKDLLEENLKLEKEVDATVNYPSLTQGASPFPSCLHGRTSSGSSGGFTAPPSHALIKAWAILIAAFRSLLYLRPHLGHLNSLVEFFKIEDDEVDISQLKDSPLFKDFEQRCIFKDGMLHDLDMTGLDTLDRGKYVDENIAVFSHRGLLAVVDRKRLEAGYMHDEASLKKSPAYLFCKYITADEPEKERALKEFLDSLAPLREDGPLSSYISREVIAEYLAKLGCKKEALLFLS